MSHVFLLLLCVSMHACYARRLGLIAKESDCDLVHLSAKALDIEKLHRTSIQLELGPSVSQELKAQGQREVKFIKARKIHGDWVGAITLKQKDYKGFWKGGAARREAISVHKNIVVSSQNMLQAPKMQGLKRQERSLLGSSPNDIEKAVDSKENDIVEDVAVMDYAQPHRKPPIHNEKP